MYIQFNNKDISISCTAVVQKIFHVQYKVSTIFICMYLFITGHTMRRIHVCICNDLGLITMLCLV